MALAQAVTKTRAPRKHRRCVHSFRSSSSLFQICRPLRIESTNAYITGAGDCPFRRVRFCPGAGERSSGHRRERCCRESMRRHRNAERPPRSLVGGKPAILHSASTPLPMLLAASAMDAGSHRSASTKWSEAPAAGSLRSAAITAAPATTMLFPRTCMHCLLVRDGSVHVSAVLCRVTSVSKR